ncbi:iron-sulfur cluster assembly scaffold protein [Gimesia chilikensis]|uniref:iron-sulfur cluster assembly scaffold protein n=1 Tax=Gimesia chilikensis TaxID=2605989 RepID=UPI003A93A4A5
MPRYSKTVLDHAASPRNWGTLDSPDQVGVSGVPGRGRFLVFYIRTDGQRITEVCFKCHGCGATIAAGSVLSELIEGASIKESLSISSDQLLTALGGLPSDKRHSAIFAISALHNALAFLCPGSTHE